MYIHLSVIMVLPYAILAHTHDHKHIHAHARMWDSACLRQVCVHVSMCVHAYEGMYACMYACMHECMNTCRCVCVRTCVCMRVCYYVCLCICTHAHTYVFIFNRRQVEIEIYMGFYAYFLHGPVLPTQAVLGGPMYLHTYTWVSTSDRVMPV